LEMTADKLPHPVIRPYPSQYISSWVLKDGTSVILRPIRPEDEKLIVNFHERLSEDSVYMRYLAPLHLSQRIAHERLIKVCFNDYDRELGLVAVHQNRQTREQEILGIGRLVKSRSANKAEFSLLVVDKHQRSGLGKELLRRLVHVAREQGLSQIIGYILHANRAMLHLSEKLGFRQIRNTDDPLVKVELDLPKAGSH
jgi:acetyltransferase